MPFGVRRILPWQEGSGRRGSLLDRRPGLAAVLAQGVGAAALAVAVAHVHVKGAVGEFDSHAFVASVLGDVGAVVPGLAVVVAVEGVGGLDFAPVGIGSPGDGAGAFIGPAGG